MNPALAHDPGVTSDETVAGAPGAMLVIVSGPSGVGKDTVIQSLDRIPTKPVSYFVVTCTTRPSLRRAMIT